MVGSGAVVVYINGFGAGSAGSIESILSIGILEASQPQGDTGFGVGARGSVGFITSTGLDFCFASLMDAFFFKASRSTLA